MMRMWPEVLRRFSNRHGSARRILGNGSIRVSRSGEGTWNPHGIALASTSMERRWFCGVSRGFILLILLLMGLSDFLSFWSDRYRPTLAFLS